MSKTTEECPVCELDWMARRDGLGTPWKCTNCGFRVHQGYLELLRATREKAVKEAFKAGFRRGLAEGKPGRGR